MPIRWQLIKCETNYVVTWNWLCRGQRPIANAATGNFRVHITQGIKKNNANM